MEKLKRLYEFRLDLVTNEKSVSGQNEEYLNGNDNAVRMTWLWSPDAGEHCPSTT